MTLSMRRATILVWLVPALAHADPPPPDPTPADPALEARLAKLQQQIDDLKATANAALDVSTAPDANQDPTFRVYGFIDMGLQKVWTADDPVLPSQKTTFVLGNVNLYFDFHPHPDWSSLIEVRLTNYPTGTEQYGIPLAGVDYTRTNTTAQDPGNGDGYDTVRWGAIVLQRAYIQWQHDQRLGVRVGQFLTPYGIWNVDHGSPTLISLYRPRFQSQEMFPERQLGLELFGTFQKLPFATWQLEYHAYVSNGRTPGVVDLTDDKMLGGRVVVSTAGAHPMAFGVSALTGNYVDQQHNLDALTGQTSRPTTIAYHEDVVGVDASLDLGPWRLRGEAAMRHKDYEKDKRAASWIPGSYVADGYEADAYGLVAYRIAHTKLEPYVYGEIYRWPTPLGEGVVIGSVGANYHFTPNVQLKLQVSHSDWYGGTDETLGKLDGAETYVASKLVMGF